MTIDQIIRNTEELNISKVLQESVDDTTEELKNYQQQQMYAGQRADGENIDPLHGKYKGYALFTVLEKQKKGQVTNRVTLKDEGNFYLGIRVTATQKGVDFKGTDEKTDTLIAYYGPQIFGLNKDFSLIYSENDLTPLATEKIKKQIFK